MVNPRWTDEIHCTLRLRFWISRHSHSFAKAERESSRLGSYEGLIITDPLNQALSCCVKLYSNFLIRFTNRAFIVRLASERVA